MAKSLRDALMALALALSAAIAPLATSAPVNAAQYTNPNGSVSSGVVPEIGRAEVTTSNPMPIGAGNTVSVCVTPTVTASNAYGTNYVVGGLLTFSNAFTAKGSGILQGVAVTIKKVETSGFTFVPFHSNPSNTTWTDAAVAAINAADVAAARSPVTLANYSGLGMHTIASATAIADAIAPGPTLYGVLIANGTLTNNFGSASDVQVCVKTLQDQ
jgi:hypothetical protein